jgi:hypothetical protein
VRVRKRPTAPRLLYHLPALDALRISRERDYNGCGEGYSCTTTIACTTIACATIAYATIACTTIACTTIACTTIAYAIAPERVQRRGQTHRLQHSL